MEPPLSDISGGFSTAGYDRLSGRAHPRRPWDGAAWGLFFAASNWESRR
jgi:hypothetical protein